MSRKGGREVECAGLEIRYTARSYRGFESLPFRHFLSKAYGLSAVGFFRCGVAPELRTVA